VRSADVVTFEDGRSLLVTGAARTGESFELTLAGGATIVVPAATVTLIEREVTLPAPDPEGVAADIESEAEKLRADEAWRSLAGRFADPIEASARRYGLEPALLAAVARIESNFDPYAVSNRGACGILQLIPATAKRFGVKRVFDAGENIEGGAKYLRFLLDRFGGRVDLALAGYNAGEGSVDRHGGIPPYRETRAYVTGVLRELEGSQPAR
jgi:soluble lytic murein transglycosylase-like protein